MGASSYSKTIVRGADGHLYAVTPKGAQILVEDRADLTLKSGKTIGSFGSDVCDHGSARIYIVPGL